jgi:hypothetical protein
MKTAGILQIKITAPAEMPVSIQTSDLLAGLLTGK